MNRQGIGNRQRQNAEPLDLLSEGFHGQSAGQRIILEASIDFRRAGFHPELTSEQGLIVEALSSLGLYDREDPDRFGYTAVSCKKRELLCKTGRYRRKADGSQSDGIYINTLARDGSIRDTAEYDLVHYLEQVASNGKALIAVYDRAQLRGANDDEIYDAAWVLNNPSAAHEAVKGIIEVSGI